MIVLTIVAALLLGHFALRSILVK
ncbi:hypothetical protein [Metallosphaera hakonensis]|nr:hypothetical protein [Metallosphaera hakonensis]